MTPYSVGWTSAAEDQLADIWLNAANPQAVASAIAPYIESGDYVKFLTDVFQPCLLPQNIIRVKYNAPLRNLRLGGEGEAFEHILKILNQDDTSGVGISYCSRILKDSTKVGFNKLMNTKGADGKSECGNHASVIVAKRARAGKCQFMIRNTWGDACKLGRYDKKWTCERDKSGVEEGIWLDAKTLSQNIYGLTYFDNTPGAK